MRASIKVWKRYLMKLWKVWFLYTCYSFDWPFIRYFFEFIYKKDVKLKSTFSSHNKKNVPSVNEARYTLHCYYFSRTHTLFSLVLYPFLCFRMICETNMRCYSWGNKNKIIIQSLMIVFLLLCKASESSFSYVHNCQRIITGRNFLDLLKKCVKLVSKNVILRRPICLVYPFILNSIALHLLKVQNMWGIFNLQYLWSHLNLNIVISATL